MKWIVEGANPKTGRELSREVEAATRDGAEAYARERGMFVANVTPVFVAPVDYESSGQKNGLPVKPIPTMPGPVFICPNPNCDYQGASVRTKRGNELLAFILILLGIVPGILYFAFFYGPQDNCPKCGIQIKI